MTDLVHFSFRAELAIEAAHRMIDAYRAWQIRQNQRAAELFSYSCLAFGREINPASLSFDELKSSKISIDDPLKSESIAALVETYLAIISSLDWQSSIGQDSSLVKYSGVLYSKIGPLIEGFRECLSLAEKAITYLEVADSPIGSASVGSAINPSDAKPSEPAGSENTSTLKPKAGYLEIILDETRQSVHRSTLPATKPIEIKQGYLWHRLCRLVRSRGAWCENLCEMNDEYSVSDSGLRSYMTKLRSIIEPLRLDIECLKGSSKYRLIELDLENTKKTRSKRV